MKLNVKNIGMPLPPFRTRNKLLREGKLSVNNDENDLPTHVQHFFYKK